VRLIALLKPTIQKKTSTSRAVTPVPGEDPHRLLVERHPELADLLPAGGKPEERGEREHRDEGLPEEFFPGRDPLRAPAGHLEIVVPEPTPVRAA